jgi:hypothetical protein
LLRTNAKKRGHTIMSLHDNSRDENLIPPVTDESLSLSEESPAEHVEEQMEPHLEEMPESIEPQPIDTNELPSDIPVANYATRDGIKDFQSLGKNKMLLLGGGLLVAVLFFVFTAVMKRSPSHSSAANQTSEHKQQPPGPAKGSVTPLMDSVRPQTQDDADGKLSTEDIKRTRSANGNAANAKTTPAAVPQKVTDSHPSANNALSSVPSFSDTQQRWEEPRPYGEAPVPTATQVQQQNDLKEPSLVFVRSQPQSMASDATKRTAEDETPFLDVTPGFRILAKLQTEISSADPTQVVAVVQYTYAIGDHEVVPAGALISGHLQQADRSGYVHVKFDEIRLIDKRTERIDAVGKALDMGPIKGIVTGKNTGKNLLVRSISGVGSTLATVLGTNTGSALSEDDLIRQRLAENIGTAGDSEVMTLALNSHEVVSVPAETLIYIVFNKHEEGSAAVRKGGSSD